MKTTWDGKLPREDHLDDYLKLSAEQILEWLNKANYSLRQFLPKQSKIRAENLKLFDENKS